MRKIAVNVVVMLIGMAGFLLLVSGYQWVGAGIIVASGVIDYIYGGQQ